MTKKKLTDNEQQGYPRGSMPAEKEYLNSKQMTPSKPSSEKLEKIFKDCMGGWLMLGRDEDFMFNGEYPFPLTKLKAALRQYIDKEVLKGRREEIDRLGLATGFHFGNPAVNDYISGRMSELEKQ